MNTALRVAREHRNRGRWAAYPALEDAALRRVTAPARRWSALRVGATAIGGTGFLACEAIGAALTLDYGFVTTASAVAASVVLMALVSLPIAYHAAREGLGLDLLTRGAGFGYFGSTIASLIHGSFSVLLLAIEASILSSALTLLLGIPLWLAHVLSALVAIPLALWGMAALTRFQGATQPLWVLLQLAPIAFLLWSGDRPAGWTGLAGRAGAADGSVDPLLFGLAGSTLLALLPQIGAQTDVLRFLPPAEASGRARWWAALVAGGAGWALVAGLKLMLGSALLLFALHHGLVPADESAPTALFNAAFREMTRSPAVALALTGLLVIVCQLKANANTAYAGSIAWSNVFARLTHAHPGRVVWLAFNVLLALLLMEVGVLRAIEGVLLLYANLAAAWIGAVSADLSVSKPLGLSPAGIEYKRAHLYDINPVGIGAMALSLLGSMPALAGLFGPLARAFAPLLGLGIAFVAAPAIALATRGRFYVARQSTLPAGDGPIGCTICGSAFERPEIAFCPAHRGPICSLCCTLEARCHDLCKHESRVADQAARALKRILPAALARALPRTVAHFIVLLAAFTSTIGALLYLIDLQYAALEPAAAPYIATTLWMAFGALTLLCAIAAWLLVLAQDSRSTAARESAIQTSMLMEEIAAHTRTDAALQKAKEAAEAANAAKSRYLAGVSHEIRSPLNAIYGYSQLLERDRSIDPQEAGSVIRRSSEHLTNLVDGLLDISRIESGVLKLSRDVVPFPALLEQLVDMFRMQAAAKGIEFRYAHTGRLPAFVRTDEKRLRQILINLLSNAVKYTRAGHAALHVRYRSQIAEFQVSDTGIGILPEDLERIFEPFDRGGMSDAKAEPGTGLGLAITRVLAQIMGGEVEVESTPGEGSRFTLKLMLPEPAQSPPETARHRQITGYEGPRRTILLVDDDPAQIAVLQGLLRPLGFTVYSANNGVEGIALAARCKPDIALLDIQMPAMNGWDLAAALREAHGAGLRIVMVSANAHEFAAGGDGRSAHDAFVMKPVELEMLLDVLAVQLRLAWITGGGEGGAPEASLPLPRLPGAAPYLAELKRLGRMGHVRAIGAKLDQLERELPSSRPLVEQLRARVKAFDLKTYLKLLESQTDG